MNAPARADVEYILGGPLLDWQWHTLLGILGHLPTKAPTPAPIQKPKHAPRPPSGGRGHRAFTHDEDAQILSRFRSGEPVIVLAADYDVSRPSIYAAIKRAKAADPLAQVDEPAAPASEICPKPEPVQVKAAAPVAQSAPLTVPPRPPNAIRAQPQPTPTYPRPIIMVKPRPAQAAKLPITARCSDCGRTWNLTGRVLRSAVELHEHQRDHIVDILNLEHPANA